MSFTLERQSKSFKAPIKVGPELLATRDYFIVTIRYQERNYSSELSPLLGLHKETLQEAQRQLETYLKSDPFGKIDFNNLSLDKSYFGLLNVDNLFPSVRFTIESLLLEIGLCSEQTNFSALFEMATLSLNGLLYLDPAKDLSQLLQQISQGEYKTFKIKIGRHDLPYEKEVLEYLTANLPKSVKLRLDGNQQFSVRELRELLKNCSTSQIEYLEEPLSTCESYSDFWRELKLPLALDENLFRFKEKDFDPSYVAAFILKPNIVGICETIFLIKLAHTLGLKCVISSCFEVGPAAQTLKRLASFADRYHAPQTHGLATTVFSQ